MLQVESEVEVRAQVGAGEARGLVELFGGRVGLRERGTRLGEDTEYACRRALSARSGPRRFPNGEGPHVAGLSLYVCEAFGDAGVPVPAGVLGGLDDLVCVDAVPDRLDNARSQFGFLLVGGVFASLVAPDLDGCCREGRRKRGQLGLRVGADDAPCFGLEFGDLVPGDAADVAEGVVGL